MVVYNFILMQFVFILYLCVFKHFQYYFSCNVFCPLSIFVFQSQKDMVPFFSQPDSTLSSQMGDKAFKIPLSIRQRICATFDTANAKGKDWQLLAQKLHINRWARHTHTVHTLTYTHTSHDLIY